MGNCALSKQPSGRLVYPDGRVTHFSDEQYVAQVMIKYPDYYIGLQRSTKSILAGDEFIQPGQIYFFIPANLIPPDRFQWQKKRDHVGQPRPKRHLDSNKAGRRVKTSASTAVTAR